MDGPLAQYFSHVVELTSSTIIYLGAIVIITPIFILPGILFAIVAAYIGHIYIKAQLCVKREKSNARSPVLAHFGAAIAGLGNAPFARVDFFSISSLLTQSQYQFGLMELRTRSRMNHLLGLTATPDPRGHITT